MALTALQVAKLAKEVGTHRIDHNLYLKVQPSRRDGVRASWLFRYTLKGKPRWMGLGPLKRVPLKRACEKAKAHGELLGDGLDPLEEKRERELADRLAAANTMTFGQCAAKYVAAHAPSWKNDKHANQWRACFGLNDARRHKQRKPAPTADILGLPVAAIDQTHVLRVLEPIWTATPETASRVRQRVEAVLDWAKVRGYRTGENPARLKGHLDKLLPATRKLKQVRNHPALSYAELPAFMAELRDREGISARALEFTILTAARTGEVLNATWDEIDLDAAVWTIPAQRMKAGREHRVPLSGRAVEILQALPREDGNPHVFIGTRKGAGLSHMALLNQLRAMRPGLTVHGFRSTFRDWAAERTNFPREVCEAALAHAIESRVEAAYRRGDLFAKRQQLMAAWSKYCASRPTASGDNVVALQGAKA